MDSPTKVRVRTVAVRGYFADPLCVWQKFLEIVNRELLGVCVINSTSHIFPGGGMTGLILLSESHAAIHTWPEENYAWFELATCGDPEDCNRFENTIRLAFEAELPF